MRQLVAVLPDQVDGSNAGAIREHLLTLTDCAATVLIADMAATVSCDHAGADALARVYERAVVKGTELRLVITAPAVRRVIVISGLDRLVSIFPTLEAARAAQHPAAVLRLFPKAGGAASAGPTPPDGPRPVTWLPVARTASSASPAQPAEQAMRRRFEEALTQFTGGVFRAGLTLEGAAGMPAAGLRRAVEETLCLLDRTISEARTTVLALHSNSEDGRPDARASSGTVPRARMDGRPVPFVTPDEEPRRRSKLLADTSIAARRQSAKARERSAEARGRSAEARERSAKARERALILAGRSVATHHQVAATLGRLADRHPHRSLSLWTLSEAATTQAARMRQWAQDHTATA